MEAATAQPNVSPKQRGFCVSQTDHSPASPALCVRCGAPAASAITAFVSTEPATLPHCDDCWKISRTQHGALMLEGPLPWGQSWDEVENWLARARATAASSAIERLLAHELRRQSAHLAGNPRDSVTAFLREFPPRSG